MELKNDVTDRGFKLIEFNDAYDSKCNIQKSSLATDEAIWLGIAKAKPIILASKLDKDATGWVDYPIPEDVYIETRMHLTREQVKELIPILQKFVDTGGI